MTLDARTLATGPGWHVRDVICTAGPHDHPFEEQHDTVAVAAVTGGTFQYRTTHGSALLAPGAVLLGNYGAGFECSHDHGVGDRCLSLHFAPDYWERVVAAIPGVRTSAFALPRIPPMSQLVPLVARLVAARERSREMFEELALDFAGAVLRVVTDARRSSPAPSGRDVRRVSEAVRQIEVSAHLLDNDTLSVGRLARDAGVSPYHFLRTFRRLVGMTPHQYVLRTRMTHAAVRLRVSDEPISAIAIDAGFNDLSTFNRRFRRVMGASPGAYRRATY